MTQAIKVNPTSNEYRALVCAANGTIEELRTFEPKVLNQLTPVQADPLKKFTPLHYALMKQQWAAVAFLIHAGCSASIMPVGSTSGTALSMLSKDEKSLHNLLSAFIESGMPWNLDALVPLIANDELLVQRRYVLNDLNLLMRVGSHGKKPEALVMIASLMVGSYHWQGRHTDYLHLDMQNSPLPFDGTINCNQLLMYASFFCGVPSTIFEPPSHLAQSEKYLEEYEQLLAGKRPEKTLAYFKQVMSKHLGLPENEKERILLPMRKAVQEKIRVFYIEVNKEILHYGLLIQLNGESYTLHIDSLESGSDRVVLNKPAQAFEACRRQRGKVYLSMLPWI